MKTTYSPQWSLNELFRGGSSSPEFKQFLDHLNGDISALTDALQQQTAEIQTAIKHWEELSEKIGQASTYVACLQAQDVHDTAADLLEGNISELQARFENVSNLIDARLKELPEETFKTLLQNPKLSAIAFPLTERRRLATEKLGIKEEGLINDLSVDGYHGWSQLYGNVIGKVTVPVTAKDGAEVNLSWGQAYTRLSSPFREERKMIFDRSSKVWQQNEHIFASILNHIGGFRLKTYGHRKWPLLKEALDHNRMQPKTLDAMWEAVKQNKSIFVEYLHCKARLLNLKNINWYDQEAPLVLLASKAPPPLSYDEAAHFIIKTFGAFSPQMAAFAKTALEKKWVEAEDRGGKRPGGFCSGVPLNKQSRIFMTYTGTEECIFTLAHELGHAFHNHVIYTLPEMARHFPMNLAETASTFAEMIVSEAAMQQEKNPLRQLNFLDSKLKRAIIFLFNIHARFLFETRYYEQRKKGSLSAEELCNLMIESQKEAYCNALDEYHPYFWASKMHFNLTEIPFYNFPYTFGYLFSLKIFLKAQADQHFEKSYIELLADTGRMNVETLADKHLGEDLTQSQFWQQPLDFLKKDAVRFIEISNGIA